MDVNNIPIIIVSYNRKSYLRDLVNYLLEIGEENIIIFDNNSTYPPLLEWFDEIINNKFISIVRSNVNYGHTAIWDSGLYNQITNNDYFIYTDHDIIPSHKFKKGWKQEWVDILEKYKVNKVGSAISILDLPQHFSIKDEVIKHETQFWNTQIEPNMYLADIDTTFALYRKGCPYLYGPSIRLSNEYIIKHRPWYIDSNNISDEDKYYLDNINKSTHWSQKIDK